MDPAQKNLNSSAKCDRQACIDSTDPNISIRCQCELLGVSRVSVYRESSVSAISMHEAHEYFTTDQGVPFSAVELTAILKVNGIKISMDGKGHAIGNVFTERLWRSLKYESIDRKGDQAMREAESGIAEHMAFYDTAEFHGSFDYSTRHQVHISEYKAKDHRWQEILESSGIMF